MWPLSHWAKPTLSETGDLGLLKKIEPLQSLGFVAGFTFYRASTPGSTSAHTCMSWEALCLCICVIATNLYRPCVESWPSEEMSELFRAGWAARAGSSRGERQRFGVCSDYRAEFPLQIKKSEHPREMLFSLEDDCLCSLASPFISEKVLEPNIQLPFQKKRKREIKQLSFNAWSPVVNYTR